MVELMSPFVTSRPEDPALVDETGVTTWRELNERANQFVHALRARGIEDHATIAVMSGNRRELFEAFVGAMHANWLAVPVNWHWVADELSYVLENSGAQALIVDDRFVEVATVARADPRTSKCTTWIVMGGAPEGFEAFDDVLAGADAGEPADQGMGGPMFYTSGTTGFPKGVRGALSQTGAPVAVWSLIAASYAKMLSLPADGVTLLEGPAYHSAQFVFAMFPLLVGSTVVMRHRFEAAEMLELIDAHGVTNVHLVPTQFVRLLKVDEARRRAFDGSSLRTVFHGAAPCSPQVKRDMLAWWGPVVSEYYGGTEGGFLSIITGDEWLEKPGSLGRPVETVEIQVVDDEQRPVDAGVSGQIYFRSRLGFDFEYHGDADKTAVAHLADGWGTLGDIGYIDDDGYLFMSDRKIDMIISGGVNIYPAEVEGVLVQHREVADAAVFGVPDDEMGESVMAVVELLEPGAAGDRLSEELIEFCGRHLAGYKVPRRMEFTDQLPRHETGKLYKRLLRDPHWEGTGRTI
jgi:long-chain acyl-CoA synthetase